MPIAKSLVGSCRGLTTVVNWLAGNQPTEFFSLQKRQRCCLPWNYSDGPINFRSILS